MRLKLALSLVCVLNFVPDFVLAPDGGRVHLMTPFQAAALAAHLPVETVDEITPARTAFPQIMLQASSTTWSTPWFRRFVEHLRQRARVTSFDVKNCAAADTPPAIDQVLNFSGAPLPDACVGVSQLSLAPTSEMAYAYLQHLGYRFWHPFRPVIPSQLKTSQLGAFSPTLAPPYLAQRGFTPHTMHPIELTHVLNGWGLNGPQDLAGWQAMLPQWEAYLAWLVAHRQNKVEWVLLEKGRWKAFSRSAERQRRLRVLVKMAHDWGVQVGIDAPFALQQQNGWRLLPDPTLPLPEAYASIEQSLDYLMGANFDFVTTEMGSTEFSNGGADQMLQWLNHATHYLSQRYQKSFATKVHISSGQEATGYADPETGKPLNFNFLPLYADPRLGVFPHTVQIYALDDPAPTYGRENFKDMLRFMGMVTAANRNQKKPRAMYWYPETAYWVNYDNHVPLFLPVYAHRRLHDLYLIDQHKIQLSGQMVFTSGWSWGYWLNDVLSANSVAQPSQAFGLSETEAMKRLLSAELNVFEDSTQNVVQLLQDTMAVQYRLLILGEVKGKAPVDIVKNNGMAYVSGQETWSQLGSLIRKWGLTGFQTQPDRWHFEDVAKDPVAAAAYRQQVRPLLQAMDTEFSRLARRADAIAPLVPEHVQVYFAEMQRGLWVNTYRVRFVSALFEAALGQHYHHPETTQRYLQMADTVLQQAQTQVTAQHQDLAAPWIIEGAGQKEARLNPTVYRYGYLWPADTLYYWRRDYQQVKQNYPSPCLMSIINPLEVAFPDPEAEVLLQELWQGLGRFPFFKDCVSAP